MNEKLLSLPWQIQLSLASGYLAYLVAYAGIRQHHTATDTIFRSFSFGLVGTALILWAPLLPVWLELTAVASTLVAGALWRWKGMSWAKTALGTTNITWADDIPTAWLTITALRTDLRPSQIAVDLDNGRTLVCDDTRRFESAPFGPCIFGLDGSVALYVTAERRDDGTWIEKDDVEDPYDGPRITYIPSGAIKRVELRLWDRSIARGDLEAVLAADVQATAPVVEVERNPEYK